MNEPGQMTGSAECAISARAVHKRYGRVRALTDFTLEVKRGTVVGLSGANGSGKSTALGILAGLIRASEGQVTVLGHASGSPDLAGMVGVLPEGTPFPPAVPVGDYMMFLARLQDLSEPARAVDEALDLICDHRWKRRRFRELSYGTRRRIGIAQAFLGNPPVVLLDEPTESLDAEATATVSQMIRKRPIGTTLVLSTHDDDLLQSCDVVVPMARVRSD